MSTLSVLLVRQLSDEQDLRLVRRVNASKRKITLIDDLSPCVQLQRLDVSHNEISCIDGVVDCRCLTWLDLSHNQLDSLIGVQALTNLVVLRASHNNITTCDDLSPLKKLKALVLSSNRLSGITGLSALKELNTLVLSHNFLETISVQGLEQLTKLSLSHNILHEVPETKSNRMLKELRLNDNKIASLPETLCSSSQLSLLDLGNNRLHQITPAEALGTLQGIRNLNLKGNPLCDHDEYPKQILEFVPGVVVLDGKRRVDFPPKRKKPDTVKDKPTMKAKSEQHKDRKKVKEGCPSTDGEHESTPSLKLKSSKDKLAAKGSQSMPAQRKRTRETSAVTGESKSSLKRKQKDTDGEGGEHKKKHHEKLDDSEPGNDVVPDNTTCTQNSVTEDLAPSLELMPFSKRAKFKGQSGASVEDEQLEVKDVSDKKLKKIKRGKSGVVGIKVVKRKKKKSSLVDLMQDSVGMGHGFGCGNSSSWI